MNIAFVISTKIWSGVKTWMLEFGGELARQGDRVHYFASDPRFLQELEGQGASVHALKFGADYNPRTVLYFWRKFGALEIDIACMNIQKELRTAGIAARLRRIPVIHRVGLPGDITAKWDQRLTRRWIVTRMLVPSEVMREEILQVHPFVTPGQVACIHNGKRIVGPPKTEKGDPVRFAISSRLDPDKRHEDLLAALKRLLDEGIANFRLDIYGEGSRREEIERTIRQTGLESRVRLAGFSRDLPALLPGYDFAVLVSGREGLPNTVLEYLAAGLPVVASDTGGTREAVEDGTNGFLFSPGDVGRLTELLKTCIALPAPRYAELSANAQRRIAERFERSTQARRLHDFFQAAVGGPAVNATEAPNPDRRPAGTDRHEERKEPA